MYSIAPTQHPREDLVREAIRELLGSPAIRLRDELRGHTLKR
jgi:hypothetical protein